MVKTKKIKKHKKIVKKIKRTKTIQNTIDDSCKFLDVINHNDSLDQGTVQRGKKEFKRTKTIDDTLKSAEDYLGQKKHLKSFI